MGGYRLYRVRGWVEVDVSDLAGAVGGGLWVFFIGEVHERGWMIEFEEDALEVLAGAGARWLGLEHFNYEQQDLLDGWLEGRIPWEELAEAYRRGPEGFRVDLYRGLIEEAAGLGLRVYGLMVPRSLAARVARGGLEALEGEPGLPVDPARVRVDYPGYAGRFYELIPREGPMARLDPRRLLEAQALKDEVLAEMAARLAARHGPGVVVAGWGHVEHVGTAPTRLAERLPQARVAASTAREAPPGEARGELEALAARGLLLAGHAVVPAGVT